MDDSAWGSRDRRGNWTPFALAKLAPIWAMPPQPLAVLKWLPAYLLPWTLTWALSAWLWWNFVLPPPEVAAVLAWGWVLKLLAVNSAAVFVFFGALELRLYIARAQGNRFKYNPAFPADKRNEAFWFRRQNLDGAIRTFTSGVPVWTAYQVLVVHAFAAGWVTPVAFAEHPVYLGLLWLVLPIFHEAHFFCIHRLIHTPWLYKWVHSVHHNSVNPSPWSSLSMHPVEHLLYFSGALLHLLIPSHPMLGLFQSNAAGFGAVVGHIGFDKMELGEDRAIDSHAWAHYLHHKYFEVNYSDGLVPLDKLFGTFHDGSPEGQARMEARFEQRRARANAAAARNARR